MSAKERKEVEVVLFGLENANDLRKQYPELADIKEFSGLNSKEVRLCWLLGNVTSPLYKLEKKERMHKAFQSIYGMAYQENKDLAAMLKDGLPDNLREGVKRMESFNPEYRLRAKMLSEYMFETLTDMIVVAPSQLASMDVDEKKKYTDLVVKIHDSLPDMVKRLEESYGIRTVERKTKNKALVSISDVLH